MCSNTLKYTTIANGFIRRSAIKRPKRLKLKWSLSKVSDFLGQDQFIVLGNIAISVYDLQGTQLAQVLSKSPWVIAAGLIATCAGFYVMGHIMSALKFGIYQGTSTFKRYLYSTLPGELLFSLIFTFLCFYQFNSIEELTDIFIASAAAKVFLSTIFASIISILFRLLQIKQEQNQLPRTLQIN